MQLLQSSNESPWSRGRTIGMSIFSGWISRAYSTAPWATEHGCIRILASTCRDLKEGSFWWKLPLYEEIVRHIAWEYCTEVGSASSKNEYLDKQIMLNIFISSEC